MHVPMEILSQQAGIKLTHVPYTGAGPAVVALLGGQIQAVASGPATVLQQVKAGKLRAIAVSSRERSAFVKGLPTVAESGVPGFDVSVWFGVVAPAATPRAVIAQLNVEINRILGLPGVRRAFNNQGVEALGGTPDEFAAFLRVQQNKWSKVVRESGAKAE
jgi:tripartite-type tricarboxylate transporter receptor subunit TctC